MRPDTYAAQPDLDFRMMAGAFMAIFIGICLWWLGRYVAKWWRGRKIRR